MMRSCSRRETNAVKSVSATSASLISSPVSESATACRYWIGVHASSPIASIAAVTVGHFGIVNEYQAPALAAACTWSWLQKALSPRTSDWLPGAILATVASARAVNQCAPVPERALPRRSENSPITGAAPAVLIVASSAFTPRTPE